MFIFSGSKRHLMSNMFNSSSKPFYQSAISIGLKPIPIHIYVEFANRLFEQRGKLIDKSVIEEVYRMFDGLYLVCANDNERTFRIDRRG